MRSARMILTTTAATAALAFAAPGAQAAVAGDRDDGGRDNSAYSKELHLDSGHAVLAVAKLSDDWESDSGNDSKFDPETYKDKGDGQGGKGDDEGGKSDQGGKGDRGSGSGRDEGGSWGDDEDNEKPHGGMHTGGGGLATSGVTTGGLAVLGVAAAGAYALRRRRATGSAS
ncbi:hypothetical protein [Streptomyces sp. NPDC001068]|uniref:hypothetical protein n=1 Tax=Streptomyces sp. NPDC001068 TaxID=3364544 RepID=UPI0036BFD84A